VRTHAQTPAEILRAKQIPAEELRRCEDLGAAIAAGLSLGVFQPGMPDALASDRSVASLRQHDNRRPKVSYLKHVLAGSVCGLKQLPCQWRRLA
jgi:hypothetical protein